MTRPHQIKLQEHRTISSTKKLRNGAKTPFLSILLSLTLLASCHSYTHVDFSTQTYSAQGKIKKTQPITIIIKDETCTQTNNIIKEFRLEKNIVTVQHPISDTKRLISEDNLSTHQTGLVNMLAQLDSLYHIESIHAIGIESYILSEVLPYTHQNIILHPYQTQSFETTLTTLMYSKDNSHELFPNTTIYDLYQNINTYPSPSGLYGPYNYRVLRALKNINPTDQSYKFQSRVRIQPIIK